MEDQYYIKKRKQSSEQIDLLISLAVVIAAVIGLIQLGLWLAN